MEMINEQMSVLAKRTIYDSVFTNLFKAPEYTIQLYKHFIRKIRQRRLQM